MQEVDRMSLVEVVNNLNHAIEYGEKNMANIFAKEIVDRLYVPGVSEKSYEEMLVHFGYDLEYNKEKAKQKRLKR